MTTPTDAGSAELVARLRRILMHPYLENGNVMERPEPINPDGSEAADRILALEPRIRELEEALRKIAATTETAETDDGEIGVSTELDAWEMHHVARTAIKAQEQE